MRIRRALVVGLRLFHLLNSQHYRQHMAYLELSLEAYDNLIKAAGMKASSVAKVCAEQGVWEPASEEEAPPEYEAPETITTEVDTEALEGEGHD
jgi:hypothetical protein